MLEILQISENGLRANQEWLNTISHNVSNIQTPGYKKASLNFGELVGAPAPAENAQQNNFKGMGVTINSSMIDATHGDIKATGRSLDVAITDNGFLEVELENGDYAYTRVGRFSINQDGRLTTHDGLMLSSDINIPVGTKNIVIGQTGIVTAQISSEETVELGQLTLVNFNAPEFLQAIGNERYIVTEKSGQPEQQLNQVNQGFMQGFLEMSNVDLIDEMSDLMVAQRAYQLNARLIQTADQILETINNLRR